MMNVSGTPSLDNTEFGAARFRDRAAGRLLEAPPAGDLNADLPPAKGDHDLNPDTFDMLRGKQSRRAAVLVPVVAREDGAAIILTQRPDHLPSHPGQIAFPGGKIEAHDKTPLHAALREADEEIGLPAAMVSPLGFLDLYLTGTGFRIVPVVGLVDPGYELRLDPNEVAEAFEVPLSFLMTKTNHQTHSRVWQGRRRHFYAMPFEERYIWGATAGILRNLYDRLYAEG